jgi:hypothetical protein
VRRPVFLLTCLWIGTACSYYDASLLGPKGGVDAGQDVSVEVGPEGSVEVGPEVEEPDTQVPDVQDEESGQDASESGTCGSARPPEPPANSAGGGGIAFVVAVKQIDFGDAAGDPKDIGYDLDARCTCQGQGNACLREAWASADACDGPQGRDNAAGALLSKLSPLLTDFGSEDWSQAATEGDWSILLRVRGYNGTPDDDQVRLDWFVPHAYWVDKGDDSIQPAWDGNDVWPIRESSVLDPDAGAQSLEEPRFYDPHAYVTAGMLVASFPESAFQVSDKYLLDFVGSFITARVVETSGGWELQEGLLASRWKTASILGQLGRVVILGLAVCMDHPAYEGLKGQICSYADIYSGVGTPTTPCDSISAGMTFEAKPAKLGPVLPQASEPATCLPAVNPAGDTCGS